MPKTISNLTVHMFNPETDYALAADSENYTPPMSILNMKRSLALLPALHCEVGDMILIEDDAADLLDRNLLFKGLLEAKHISIIGEQRFVDMMNTARGAIDFNPWGWNKTLRNWCLNIGVNEESLPSLRALNTIRILSHRRQTIPFLSNMRDIRSDEILVPREFTDVESALDFWRANDTVFFKAPWSSSGRGLLYTKDLEYRHIEPWVRGIIHSQGSVMGEIAYDKKIDFATEWHCVNGKAMFLGVSTFYTSPRGKYQANIIKPQEEIVGFLLANSDVHLKGNNLAAIIERQRLLLENYVAQYYTGPVGIDMMVTFDGNVHPCVEINLRNTMGRVAIEMFNRLSDPHISPRELEYLSKITSGGFISPISIVDNLTRDMENN